MTGNRILPEEILAEFFKLNIHKSSASGMVVRDSSAVRRFFYARAVGRQRALLKENSGFASPTLGRHISTFCSYRILFSRGDNTNAIYTRILSLSNKCFIILNNCAIQNSKL